MGFQMTAADQNDKSRQLRMDMNKYCPTTISSTHWRRKHTETVECMTSSHVHPHPTSRPVQLQSATRDPISKRQESLRRSNKSDPIRPSELHASPPASVLFNFRISTSTS